MSIRENSTATNIESDVGVPKINEETYELVEMLSDAGIEINNVEGKLAFKAVKGALTTELISKMRGRKIQLLALLSKDDVDRENISVLPLTELQQSYWIGGAGELGVNGADHWYNQFEVSTLDVGRLNHVLQMLIARHDYLRSFVTEEGLLKILDPKHTFTLVYEDHREIAPLEQEKAIKKAKEKMCQPIPTNQWPLYKMYVQQFNDGFRVHVGGRLLIGDATSWQFYANELGALLDDPERKDLPDPKKLAVAILNRFRHRLSREYLASRQYWLNRELPASPSLPVRSDKMHFTRLVEDFDDSITKSLVTKARDNGLTLDSVFMALYALVLDRWSQESRFSINVLHGNKRHAGFPLGNFGNILKMEVNVDRKCAFADLAQSIRKQFLLDMSHASVDGVKVQRIGNHHAEFSGIATEVSYSSGLGLGKPTKAEIGLAQIGWGPKDSHLQTPGVIIDLQVFFTVDGIRIHFDMDQGRLGRDVGQAIFSCISSATRDIASKENWKEKLEIDLPHYQVDAINQANATEKKRTVFHLHTLINRRFHDRDGVALKAGDRAISYSQLSEYVDKLISLLIQTHADTKIPIAVVAKKSWQQIAATNAIVKAGGIYMPIDPSWPPKRIYSVLNRTNCQCTLADQDGFEAIEKVKSEFGLDLSNNSIENSISRFERSKDSSNTIEKEQIAYIIFTSGSTGEPKGVATSHDSVANTIEDMIDRFGIDENDSVLGVSALHFDLSVFDIFAVLGAGGKLVLPPDRPRPDPEELFNLAQNENITLWNTVPAIMEMVTEYALPRKFQLRSMRCIFLSGDWIPIDLPAKIKKVCPQARIIGLGGATEASIWSNWFEIESIPENWTSIPYGKALANQALYVVDRHGQLSPDWVEGDLVIAGQGLAYGYWNSPEETLKRFKPSMFDGQRIYVTGDRARRWPGGTIEFLGRVDNQIKLNGYRIELGDIISALKNCTGVKNAVAIPVGTRGRNGIAGFVSPELLNIESIKKELFTKIPSYMVPSNVFTIDEIPLTSNGKVDQQKLIKIACQNHKESHLSAPTTQTQIDMAKLWEKVLQTKIEDCNIGFFEVGGDSLLLIRLINLIEKKFGVRPTITEILGKPTIKGMEEFINRCEHSTGSVLMPMRIGKHNKPVVVLVHPVGGTAYCYKPLLDISDKQINYYGVQSIGLNTHSYSVEKLAKLYASELQKAEILPDHIIGWSFGGIVAAEMQRAFKREAGCLIPITLIDPWVRINGENTTERKTLEISFVCDVLYGSRKYVRENIEAELENKSMYQLLKSNGNSALGTHVNEDDVNKLFQQFVSNTQALLAYQPVYPEQATIWVAESQQASDFPYLKRLTLEKVDLSVKNIDVHNIDADHYSIMKGDALKIIVSTIDGHLLSKYL